MELATERVHSHDKSNRVAHLERRVAVLENDLRVVNANQQVLLDNLAKRNATQPADDHAQLLERVVAAEKRAAAMFVDNESLRVAADNARHQLAVAQFHRLECEASHERDVQQRQAAIEMAHLVASIERAEHEADRAASRTRIAEIQTELDELSAQHADAVERLGAALAAASPPLPAAKRRSTATRARERRESAGQDALPDADDVDDNDDVIDEVRQRELEWADLLHALLLEMLVGVEDEQVIRAVYRWCSSDVPRR